MTDATRPPLFGIASAPARLASRLRPNLAAAVEEDARFFIGTRRWLFALLAVVAIAYPLGVSFFRAVTDWAPSFNGDLDNALFPLFFQAYSESMPFMLAAIGVGILSPTLGVLMLALFLPADILASAFSQDPGAQLVPAELAIPARILSVAILWIAVIEVPLAARRWVAARQARSAVARPRWTGAVALGIGTGLLGYVWVNAMPWLIQPVHSWTVQGGPGGMTPPQLLFVSFEFAWIFAIVVGVFGLVAGMLRGPEPGILADSGASPAWLRGIGGEIVTVAGLGFLASGLFFRPDTVVDSYDLVQAVLILGALVVAGPVMTRLLPRVPTPRWLRTASPAARWVAALVMSGGGAYVAFSLVPVGAIADYLLVAIVLAVVVPVFRFVVDAGRPIAAPAERVLIPKGAGPIVAATFAILVWFALPIVVLANDGGEQGMPNALSGPAALLGGAAGAAGAAAWNSGNRYSPPKGPPLNPYGQPKPAPPPKDDGFRWWNPFTWFS